MGGWKIDGHEGAEIEKLKLRRVVVARQYFRESRNQQERERDVGGEDFKVSLSESSMREN